MKASAQKERGYAFEGVTPSPALTIVTGTVTVSPPRCPPQSSKKSVSIGGVPTSANIFALAYTHTLPLRLFRYARVRIQLLEWGDFSPFIYI